MSGHKCGGIEWWNTSTAYDMEKLRKHIDLSIIGRLSKVEKIQLFFVMILIIGCFPFYQVYRYLCKSYNQE